MAKKEWTDEERKAFADKMKAARAKGKKKTESSSQVPQPQEEVKQPDFTKTPEETVSNTDDLNTLIKQVLELQKNMLLNGGNVAAPAAGPQVQNGKLTGTVTRYSVDKNRYPDPSERLAKEPRLARFAFDLNYILEFKMVPTSYTTIDNIRQVEPKFELKLIAKVIDPATGEDTGGRYRLCTMVLFEDPDAAITVANEQGLNVDSENEAEFLNEMRYIRMRDWLLGAFYPEQVTTVSNTEERVIGNRVVDFYTESNATGSVKVPFDDLTKFKG